MWSDHDEIPDLGEREVHVWVVPLDDPDKRRRRELAHLAQGALLSGYLDLTPAMLEFERGPSGKPRLAGEPLQFNLSHSERLALLAVTSRSPIGVDVQAPHPNASKPWFVNRICTPRERSALGASPAPDDLLRLWVRKEAVIKARGDGSYVAVGELEVLDDLVDGDCSCHDLELPDAPGYRAALAVIGEGAGTQDMSITIRPYRWA